MSLKIEKIDVKELGPLVTFSENLKQINLIYGRNEQGKTYLVEFILRRLFRYPGNFFLRPDQAPGKIWVSGLEDELSEFSNTSPKKLEDYWEKSGLGLPENMARLLVVKGAELDFEENKRAGISKAAVKAFLSNEKLLDKIQERIQKTIRSAVYENGQIFGENRGNLKERNNLMEKLNNLDELIGRVDRDYSGGPVYKLQEKINNITEQLELLQHAKRYSAWSLYKKISEIKRNFDQLKEAGLDKLLTDYDLINFLNSELFSKQKKLKELQSESAEYPWLETAIREYQRLLNQGVVQIKNVRLYLSAAGLLAGLLLCGIGAGISMFVEPMAGMLFYVFGLLSLLFGIIFGFLYIRQYLGARKNFAGNLEAERIRQTFEEKFGKKFSDLASLQTEFIKLQATYYSVKALEEDIEEVRKKVVEKENAARQIFSRLGIDPGDRSGWGSKVSKLHSMKKNLEKRVTDLELDLASLDVDESEYLAQDPGAEYEKDKMQELQNQLQQAERELLKEKQTLEFLEREIRSMIGVRETRDWEDLLENLRITRAETLQDYCSLSASILAGIIVNKVVEEARKQEDEKISDYLKTEMMRDPLLNLTGRYERISLEGEKLILSDAYDSFDLSELSTGAREQVLLALRLGLAANLMGKNSAFLILDDAFQHSDWKRREGLVQNILKLAENGWQIIYFSMDDHIMQLFDQYAEGLDYKKIKLPAG